MPGGDQWLEEFVIESRSRWSQCAESSTAVSMDGRPQFANISDEVDGGDLAGTRVVVEAVRAALDEQILFSCAECVEQDHQVTQLGGSDQ